MASSSFEAIAAPIATNNSEFLGNITSLSFNFSVFINLFRSSDKKLNGPPKNATSPFIGLPQASPLIV